jgi:hypothetical protein
MATTFDISEVMAVWLGNTAKNLATGLASEGIGLPAAVALSAREYYRDVRNVTPPANGGTVGTVALARGKAAITIDLYKAFRVTSKVVGKKVAAPLDWYIKHRNSKGHFSGKLRLEISVDQFRAMERELHRRVGWMQSGWNSALTKFGVSNPGWVKNKNGSGSVSISKSVNKMVITAKNNVSTVQSVDDMQRRLDFVSKVHKKKLEKAAAIKAQKAIDSLFL